MEAGDEEEVGRVDIGRRWVQKLKEELIEAVRWCRSANWILEDEGNRLETFVTPGKLIWETEVAVDAGNLEQSISGLASCTAGHSGSRGEYTVDLFAVDAFLSMDV